MCAYNKEQVMKGPANNKVMIKKKTTHHIWRLEQVKCPKVPHLVKTLERLPDIVRKMLITKRLELCDDASAVQHHGAQALHHANQLRPSQRWLGQAEDLVKWHCSQGRASSPIAKCRMRMI